MSRGVEAIPLTPDQSADHEGDVQTSSSEPEQPFNGLGDKLQSAIDNRAQSTAETSRPAPASDTEEYVADLKKRFEDALLANTERELRKQKKVKEELDIPFDPSNMVIREQRVWRKLTEGEQPKPGKKIIQDNGSIYEFVRSTTPEERGEKRVQVEQPIPEGSTVDAGPTTVEQPVSESPSIQADLPSAEKTIVGTSDQETPQDSPVDTIDETGGEGVPYGPEESPEMIRRRQIEQRVRSLKVGDIIRTLPFERLKVVDKKDDSIFLGDNQYLETKDKNPLAKPLEYSIDEVVTDVMNGAMELSIEDEQQRVPSVDASEQDASPEPEVNDSDTHEPVADAEPNNAEEPGTDEQEAPVSDDTGFAEDEKSGSENVDEGKEGHSTEEEDDLLPGDEDGPDEPDSEDAIEEEHPDVEKYSPEWLEQQFAHYQITPENLETLNGFKDLSEGQKILVFENFKQLFLGRIQEEAAAHYKTKTAGSGFFRRMWRTVGKSFFVAGEKKSSYKELVAGGIEVHRPMLQQLVDGMVANGPSAEIVEGKLQVDVLNKADIPDYESLHDEEKGLIRQFNDIAEKYSHIPYEWSLESATKEQKKQFKEKQAAYTIARAQVLEIIASRIGAERAAVELSQAESIVRLNQFLNENPDVEKTLGSIRDKKTWTLAFKNAWTERGIYMAGGAASRYATATLLGVVAVPATAAAVGGLMAYRRSTQSLAEQDILARKGGKDTSKTAQRMVSVQEEKEIVNRVVKDKEGNVIEGAWMSKDTSGNDVVKNAKGEVIEVEGAIISEEVATGDKRKIGAAQRIIDLVDRIGTAKDDSEAMRLLATLDRRVHDVEAELAAGRVNFGSQGERVANEYALVQALGRGKTMLIAYEKYFSDEQRESIAGKIEKHLQPYVQKFEAKEKDTKKQRSRYVLRRTVYGAVLAGGFATAGRVMADWWSGTGEHELASQVSANVKGNSEVHESIVEDVVEKKARLMSEGHISSGSRITSESPEHIPGATPSGPPSEAHTEPIISSATKEVPSSPVGQKISADDYLKEAELGKPAVASKTVEAVAKAAVETPKVGELTVQIHEGSNEIWSIRDALVAKGFDKDVATKFAEGYAAAHHDETFNLLHDQDTFKLEVDYEALRSGNVTEAAQSAHFIEKSFVQGDEHLAPAHDLPPRPTQPEVIARPEQAVVAEPVVAPKVEAPSVVFKNHEAEEFFTRNHAAFDPATRELRYDLNGDGVISDKEIAWRLGSQFDKVDHYEAAINERGNLEISAWKGSSYEVTELTPDGHVSGYSGTTEQAIAAANVAAKESAHGPIFMLPRELGARVDHVTNAFARISTQTGKGAIDSYPAHGLLHRNFMFKGKEFKAFTKLLMEQGGFDKNTSNSVAKDLSFVFKTINAHEKIPESVTVRDLLDRVQIQK